MSGARAHRGLRRALISTQQARHHGSAEFKQPEGHESAFGAKPSRFPTARAMYALDFRMPLEAK